MTKKGPATFANSSTAKTTNHQLKNQCWKGDAGHEEKNIFNFGTI